ncbi:MAG: carboxypeptidase-like regulatory domain-containing protein, partial [archaeon]|nr:carboxypeptidase-like regulatory domain-containing protein [archaeon]
MRFLNYILFLFLFGVSSAGTDGTIRGKVTDEDGTALIGTQIYIPELEKGAAADLDGNFIMLNIPVGEYEVRFLMIGYQTKVMGNVGVVMDQTQWLNVSLPEATVEGEVVYVSSERALVEKGTTSKKITVSKEAIETLPIRDVSELYNLQSGVVKIDAKAKGIPDHAERGLEEVHVRGGRSGEIAYMIDGMYIRNPIYGGIGNGT